MKTSPPVILFLLTAAFAVPVRTGEALTGDGAVEFQAVLRPARVVELSSATVGILGAVLVDRGDRVTPGQVLAVLDSEVERADLEVVRARAESRTGVNIAEAQLGRIQTRFGQSKQLFAEGIMSAEELLEVQTELQVAELGALKAHEDRHQAQLELKRAEARLRQRTVFCPVDGVVVERHLSPGELVDRSENAVILEVAQLDPLFVEVRVPQSMLPTLARGDKAVLRPEFPVERDFECAIQTIDPVIDAATGTLRVRLTLPNPDLDIPAGLHCTVRFLE
jgi:RND family efflux transporter MFP subunit